MSITDICLNIPFYENVILDQNYTFDINKTISFIEGFRMPLIFNKLNETQICGPLVKILENLAKRIGSK